MKLMEALQQLQPGHRMQASAKMLADTAAGRLEPVAYTALSILDRLPFHCELRQVGDLWEYYRPPVGASSDERNNTRH